MNKPNNLFPYLPFGSLQYPRLLSRIRNAWVALVTSPNRISIQILEDFADNLKEVPKDVLCKSLTACYRCSRKVQCYEETKELTKGD
jgi:hypothetical protein